MNRCSSQVHITKHPQKSLSQQTGTCSSTSPPTRNTQFPLNDSDKTTPSPGTCLLVLQNRKASLVASASSTTHLTWPPSPPGFLPTKLDRDAASRAVVLSLASLAHPSQPALSCPPQGTGPEQTFQPGTQTWPCKTGSISRSMQVVARGSPGWISGEGLAVQLQGLHEHLVLPTAFVLLKSNVLLLSSGIRIDKELARRTYHTPPLYS